MELTGNGGKRRVVLVKKEGALTQVEVEMNAEILEIVSSL